jgi:hypothetical protein
MEFAVPTWLGPLLALLLLVGFIGFALRQGTKVKSDKDASDSGTGTEWLGGDKSSAGDGHSGH